MINIYVTRKVIILYLCRKGRIRFLHTISMHFKKSQFKKVQFTLSRDCNCFELKESKLKVQKFALLSSDVTGFCIILSFL